MTKEAVKELLNKFKENKIAAIFVGDDYHAIHFGVDGHHVFAGNNGIAEIKINSLGSSGIGGLEPPEAPFIVTFMEYNTIHFIHAFVPGGDGLKDRLSTLVDGYEEVDELSKDEILDECIKNKVNLVGAGRTYLDAEATADEPIYGRFHGSAISLTKDGVSPSIKKLAEKKQQ